MICQLTFTINNAGPPGSYQLQLTSRPNLRSSSTSTSTSTSTSILELHHGQSLAIGILNIDGSFSSSRPPQLLHRRHPGLPLRPPRNLLRCRRRQTQAPRLIILKIHLQNMRAHVPARAAPHPDRFRAAFWLSPSISHHPDLGFHLPLHLLPHRHRCAFLPGHA